MGLFHSTPQDSYEIKIEQNTPKNKNTKPQLNTYFIRRERAPIILFFRYIGTNYHGLQYQVNSRTVDADLFVALEKAGFTPKNTHKCRGKINWSEASRTDSGVHACAQLAEFTARGVENYKCSEIVEMIQENLPEDSAIEIMSAVCPNKEFPIQKFATARRYRYLLPTHTFKYQTKEHYQYLRDTICPCFLGLQNYHNYTSEKPADHPSAKRRIYDFTFSDPFLVNGEEFVLFYIRGESFMLNQIRKMLSVVVAASYGQVGVDEIKRTMSLEKWDIQIIPGDGLMLDQIEYQSYMKDLVKVNSNNDYEFHAWRPNIEEWKNTVLFPHIANIVAEKDIFRQWVETRLKKHPISIRNK